MFWVTLSLSFWVCLDIRCDTNEEADQNTCRKEGILKKEISRPCPFCQNDKLHSVLTLHMKLIHKNQPQMIKVLSLSKQKQIKAFRILRKNDIYLYNKSEMEKENPNFICKRKQHLTDPSKKLVVCASCKGFY